MAALPVPAHENFRASLAAITNFSLSKWISEMRAASEIGRENAVLGMFTPGGHVALEDIHFSLSNIEFTFLSSVLSNSSKIGCRAVCHFCHKTASEPKHAEFHRIRYRILYQLDRGRDNC